MRHSIERPKVEGNIAVGNNRQIGFAEFGDPRGRPVFWLHGTPGARRQIPAEARLFAETNHIRLVGLDRPGIGSSTPYQYASVAEFAADLESIADCLGIGRMAVVGLSGGGPYTLAASAAMPDRIVVAGVLGGVAPAVGPDSIRGGLMSVGSAVAPVLEVAGYPVRIAAASVIKFIAPVADTALEIYARVSPEGDRRLLGRPEFKAMFLDDLLNGGRKQLSAPIYDIVAFSRPWGFRLDEVKVPVHWWHGDRDHIIPFSHGQHMVAALPDAHLYTIHGESHLAGLGCAEEILRTLLEVWDREEGK
jgi:pimeloyl-ACP methyl ester carboxylesterase